MRQRLGFKVEYGMNGGCSIGATRQSRRPNFSPVTLSKSVLRSQPRILVPRRPATMHAQSCRQRTRQPGPSPHRTNPIEESLTP